MTRRFTSTTLLALAIGALTLGAHAAPVGGPAAGTTIENTGVLEYLRAGSVASESASASLTVSAVYQISLDPGTPLGPISYYPPGPRPVQFMTLNNDSNAPVTFSFNLTGSLSATPWTARIDGGAPGTADDTVTSAGAPMSVTLPAGTSRAIELDFGPGAGNGSGPEEFIFTASGAGLDAQSSGRIQAQNPYYTAVTPLYAPLAVRRGNLVPAPTEYQMRAVTVNRMLWAVRNDGTDTLTQANFRLGLSQGAGLTPLLYHATVTTPSLMVTDLGSFSSLSDLMAAVSLEPNAQLELGVDYDVAALAAGTMIAMQLQAYYGEAGSNLPQYEPGLSSQGNSLAEVKEATLNASKVGFNCYQDVNCFTPVLLSDGQAVEPGSYVQYQVTAGSTFGSAPAPLKAMTIRDYVPAGTHFVSVSGNVNNTVFTRSGPLLWATSASAQPAENLTWTAAPPTSLPTATSSSSGPFIYVGQDTNGNGRIDSGDELIGDITLYLTVQLDGQTPEPSPPDSGGGVSVS